MCLRILSGEGRSATARFSNPRFGDLVGLELSGRSASANLLELLGIRDCHTRDSFMTET